MCEVVRLSGLLRYPTLSAKSAERMGHPAEEVGHLQGSGIPGLKIETWGTRHPAWHPELGMELWREMFDSRRLD